jgi:isopentenyl phosphate kinase
MNANRLVFLKLGGSLITDKTKPMTPQHEVIQRLANEIAQAVNTMPGLRLLIGHGSGSFGHIVANEYQTQNGGKGDSYWKGFSEVWAAARELNQIMINHFVSSGLPVIAFPPSAGIITQYKRITSWDTRPIQLALSHGLIPVVQGDVILDANIGGTILSTEAIFQYLANELHPQEILIAGLDDGVYKDPQQPQEIINHISPGNYVDVLPLLSTSEAVDVTGGMLDKVSLMIDLIKENPSLKVRIFSGMKLNNVHAALAGESVGTQISNP